MALKDIKNKNIEFYTTITNNPVDATMLPVIFKTTGKFIISYSEIDKSQSPHIWLGGEHIASGYGQDNYLDKLNLSYVSNSYNTIWNFIEDLYEDNPFLLDKDHRYSAVIKESKSASYSHNTLIIGEESIIQHNSQNSSIFGHNNYIRGENNFIIGENNRIKGNNIYVNGSYIKSCGRFDNQFLIGTFTSVSQDTSLAFGQGINERNRYNIVEISKQGDLYIKGIGFKDRDTVLYNGSNLDGENRNGTIVKPQSFQSYISDSLSYGLKFSERYTNDQISNLIGGAPETLDTLKEISDFISDVNSDFTYYPVSDYNHLTLSEYYINVWSVEKNPDTLEEYNLIEYVLKEYWKKGIRKYNDILDNFNLESICNNLNIEENSTVYNNLSGLVLGKQGLDNFFMKKSISETDTINQPDDIENTYTYIEGGTNWNKVKSLYNYLTRFEEVENSYKEEVKNDMRNAHANYEVTYYYKETSTSLITNVHQIQASYVTNNGTARSNVGYTWVPSLGEYAYLDIILEALLERPEYTKPVLSITYATDKYEIGSDITPKITFTFGDTIVNPNIIDFNNITSNDNLGYSNSYLDGDNYYGFNFNIYSDYYNSSKELTGTVNKTYTFPLISDLEERNYEIVSYINYEYTYATYMYYPQLLSNRNSTKVICHNGWFDNGSDLYYKKYIIQGKYKYYYGWDNTPDNSGDNLINKASGWDWLESNGIKNGEKQIAFTSNHSIFWFACPENYQQKNVKNFFVLYKTNIAEQDLVSNTTETNFFTTENDVSTCHKKYKVYIIDFKRQYQGEANNYVKFNIVRV